MAPRELVFTGEGDVDEFFFTYEHVEMIGKTDEDKAATLVAYLKQSAFKFYRETFTKDNEFTQDARDFRIVKRKMYERFAEKMSVAEATVEAVNLRYEGTNMDGFLEKVDDLYDQAGFKDEARFGLIKKAISSDQELLKFTVLRSAMSFEAVKEACREYADNPKVFGGPSVRPTKAKEEDSIAELCRQMEEVKLYMAGQRRSQGPDRPPKKDIVCQRCGQTGHFTYQCQLPPKEPLKCNYCGKSGHTERACYTKQADERNRAREKDLARIRILKRPEEGKKEADKPVMYVNGSRSDGDEPVLVKRDVTGQPIQKQVRFDNEGDEVLVEAPPNQREETRPARRRPVFLHPHGVDQHVPVRIQPTKRKTVAKKGKDSKKRTLAQELGKRVEQYDLLTSLAQAQSGITFGQIARGDVDNVRKDLSKAFSSKISKKGVNVAIRDRQDPGVPSRHMFVNLTVYSEQVYALLDTGAIPNVMSVKLADKLRLTPIPTTRRIIVADGTSNSCEGTVVDVPVSFGKIVGHLKFLVLRSPPYELIIGLPTMVKLRCKLDVFNQTARFKHGSTTQTLPLEYEPEAGEDTEDDFTSDSESVGDIGEDSSPDEDDSLVLVLNDKGESRGDDCVDEKLNHLSNENATAMKYLFMVYADVIARSLDDVRPSRVSTKRKFELKSEEPIFQKLRRAPPSYNEIIRHEVDRMLKAGIITPVESSWTSPVVIVSKKDGKPRFCVDYRKLNAVMKQDRWPMPKVEEIFDEVKGSKIFTAIDLFQGYWQIKMDEACKEKTTFICRYGTFQFEVMPFGLMNSGATFQRMMDKMLCNVKNVKCYVDDVVIHSATAEEHLEHLETVFKLLRKHGLRLRLKKCSFMQPRVELLGHIVDSNGVHVEDSKVDRVRKARAPRNRTELRSFLGLASYYRRFIKGFAKIALPLTEKTSESVAFEWTEEMDEAFQELKEALCVAPVLTYPDYEKPFVVSTDASSKALGAVLSQLDDNKQEHPIHYASRTLNDAEKNYSTFEREALAIVFALKKFRHYLLCQKFKLYTDHQALKYVINMRDPTVE